MRDFLVGLSVLNGSEVGCQVVNDLWIVECLSFSVA
jgi:hypothetical protein